MMMPIETPSYPRCDGAEFQPHLDRDTWICFGIFALLLVAIYSPTLKFTGDVLLASDDMAHGLFAPLVAAYVVVLRRREILRSPAAPSYWGLAVMILGGAAAVVGSVGNSATLLRFAFLISLTGCIVLIGGPTALGRLKFPLLLLLFTFPIPQVLYAEITSPLQAIATSVSQQVLDALGYSVYREGNLLELPHYHLSIVEACSGIRSLITLTFFCVLYAYFLKTTLWQRSIVIALSIPCALLLNVARITTTGVLGEWRPHFTLGIYHEALGWACLMLAFLLVLFVDRGIRYMARHLRSA